MRLWRKGRKTLAYRQHWSERLGRPTIPPEGCGIWLHAVSVGEFQAAKPLLAALRKRYPHETILVTAMTATGRELIAQSRLEGIYHSYVPYDFPHVIRRFLRRVRPKAIIIMETELWPNIFHQAQQHRIPLLLANACLSAKSFRGYQRIPALVKPMLSACTVIGAQTTEDQARFIQLGAARERVPVLGSLKFDVEIPEAQVAQGKMDYHRWGLQRPAVLAASTHPGEERLVLQAFERLRQTHPRALLILVPRHAHRFDEVAALCRTQGYETVRRSAGKDCQATTQIFLGDTLGELFFYYAMADCVFLGGSLVPEIGGHNLLEPAVLGMPLITGQFIQNIQVVVDALLAAHALELVADASELAAVWALLLENPKRRFEMGESARAVVVSHRGSLQRHLGCMEDWL